MTTSKNTYNKFGSMARWKDFSVGRAGLPQQGDEFHEHYSFWIIVIDVSDDEVVYLTSNSGKDIGSLLHVDGIRRVSRRAFFHSASMMLWWSTRSDITNDVVCSAYAMLAEQEILNHAQQEAAIARQRKVLDRTP